MPRPTPLPLLGLCALLALASSASAGDDWFPSKYGAARMQGAVQRVINPVAIR